MSKYVPQKIEKKWQRFWEKNGIYRAKDDSRKRKSYILVEFPYPSGEGLHVGHCRPYIAFDVLSRKRRMEGSNVLFPMGWDAFGLPTENYAVKTGIHPVIATKKNTSVFKRQQKSIGLSFDWSREINTSDPKYYKWTQWIFLQLFKKGLAYKATLPINWCPACKIGLANEEVVDGSCERCGAKVTKKEKEQWILRITKYADRLVRDLDKVDYPEKVKVLQKDWIGRSEGFEIKFKIKNSEIEISVFTTRIDTIFGVTYLVLAPEHPVIENLSSEITNYQLVQQYIKQAKLKSERERISDIKDKTGIKLEGIMAVNPVNDKEIPVFVADYVLLHYGTGVVMAVPAHDKRDWDFAKKYNLPIIQVIKNEVEDNFKVNCDKGAYEGEGILINSGNFNGINSEEAKEKIGRWLIQEGRAKKTVHYKLRDWIFSRQRYWGEPIPLVFCEHCAAKIKNQESIIKNKKFSQGELLNPGWIAIPEKNLPVELPNVKDYKPTETGDSPLAKVKSWVNVKCPKCKNIAKRETDVMPNWAGSNWYFLRYCDPKNNKKLADSKKLKYWMPVDWYNGGMEHSTLHLLYSRFIYKFLWDIGAVPKVLGPEPYKKRTSHGVILAQSGSKMSKSKGNVITPDEVIEQYGADTLRIYEMFMGPFEETITWDAKGVKGARRFLEKVWLLVTSKFKNKNSKLKSGTKNNNKNLDRLLHKTIKKVGEDIENLRFNTAISALMILVNEMSNHFIVNLQQLKNLLLILAPFAPHITEELWHNLGAKNSIHIQSWPKYDEKLIKEETFTLIIQINGKIRDKIEIRTDISEKEAKELALSSEKIKKWIAGQEIKKTIFIPRKLINIVL
jgi:leucyl-tRNA synthetase